MALPRISPAGQALLTGSITPLLTSAGQFVEAGFDPRSALASLRGRFPQTSRWPLPGSGDLHPLDQIVISGVALPLESPPSGGQQLEVSTRHASGTDFGTHVQHGKKQHPTRIVLLLFRDDSLGWQNGARQGKDWWYEYEKVEGTLIAKSVSRRNAVPVYYPTLHSAGIDSLVFTKVSLPQRSRGQFWTLELEGLDPRAVVDGNSKKVPPRKDISTKDNPIPPDAATKGPAAAKRGK